MGNDGKFEFERIEEDIVKEDEVDSRLLKFEGGISIKELIVSGE